MSKKIVRVKKELTYEKVFVKWSLAEAEYARCQNAETFRSVGLARIALEVMEKGGKR